MLTLPRLVGIAPLLLLLLLCRVAHSQFYSLPKRLQNLIKNREEIVQDIAKKASELYSRRAELVENCECALHVCSNEYMDAPCLMHLGTPLLCGREGRKIDSSTTMIRTPPGADPDNLDPRLKESICTFRGIQEAAERHWNERVAWIYFGSRDGHIRRYPASAGERDIVQGCKPFDPRIRPWYIAASTGPKDIVLVVDKSGSMTGIIGNGTQTKWQVTQNAVLDILETFTFADYINIVTFSDEATPLWKSSGLMNVNKENLEALGDVVRRERPRGKTNFTAAFTTAFRLLTQNCSDVPKQCSNCQKIILFLTDGRDTSGPEEGESIAPSAMAKLISELQQDLVTKTSRRATIFTYSMTDNADDAIPRQIACTNEGSWSYLGPEVNTLDALNSYSLYLADGRKAVNPIWVEPFKDFAGLGNVTTVSVPVYARGRRGRSDVFLGVAGHDVLLSEFEVEGFSADRVLEGIIDRAEQCTAAINTACESQLFRSTQDKRSVCADPFPFKTPVEDENSNLPSFLPCYEFKNHFYKRSVSKASWKKARSRCEKDGGELVSIAGDDELAFIASMADIDGSWIAARAKRRPRKQFMWLNTSLPDLEKNSEYWGVGEPVLATRDTPCCAGIDTRGILANLFARPCSQELSFVCRYSSNASCAETRTIPDQGYYKVPSLESCSKGRNAVKNPEPVPEARELDSSNVVCHFGNTSRTSEEVICCSGDPNKQRTTPRTASASSNAGDSVRSALRRDTLRGFISFMMLIGIVIAF